MRARIFLRTSLFTLPGKEAHVPDGALIIVGTITEQTAAGMTVVTESYHDEKGKVLPGVPRTLILPGAKVDHLLVEEP